MNSTSLIFLSALAFFSSAVFATEAGTFTLIYRANTVVSPGDAFGYPGKPLRTVTSSLVQLTCTHSGVHGNYAKNGIYQYGEGTSEAYHCTKVLSTSYVEEAIYWERLRKLLTSEKREGDFAVIKTKIASLLNHRPIYFEDLRFRNSVSFEPNNLSNLSTQKNPDVIAFALLPFQRATPVTNEAVQVLGEVVCEQSWKFYSNRTMSWIGMSDIYERTTFVVGRNFDSVGESVDRFHPVVIKDRAHLVKGSIESLEKSACEKLRERALEDCRDQARTHRRFYTGRGTYSGAHPWGNPKTCVTTNEAKCRVTYLYDGSTWREDTFKARCP